MNRENSEHSKEEPDDFEDTEDVFNKNKEYKLSIMKKKRSPTRKSENEDKKVIEEIKIEECDSN